jgi:hypothetical protein
MELTMSARGFAALYSRRNFAEINAAAASSDLAGALVPAT